MTKSKTVRKWVAPSAAGFLVAALWICIGVKLLSTLPGAVEFFMWRFAQAHTRGMTALVCGVLLVGIVALWFLSLLPIGSVARRVVAREFRDRATTISILTVLLFFLLSTFYIL